MLGVLSLCHIEINKVTKILVTPICYEDNDLIFLWILGQKYDIPEKHTPWLMELLSHALT